MILHSSAKLKRIVINGQAYATDENRNSLYLLVSTDIARYEGKRNSNR